MAGGLRGFGRPTQPMTTPLDTPVIGAQLPLFEELIDDAVMAPVQNEIHARDPLPESAVPAMDLLHESLTEQQIGDAGELVFASMVIEHDGAWQKASTDAQPHDCLIRFGDEWTRVQIKSSQTQQSGGFYRVNLGAHRIGVQAFAVMIRHQGTWMPPWIIPADLVTKCRWIQIWPTATHRRIRRGAFNAVRWRNAWWVVNPVERAERRLVSAYA